MSYLQEYCEMAQSYHIQQRNSIGQNGQLSPTFRASHLYKCYGCGNQPNSTYDCSQCYGKGFIRQTHPLCNIVSQILATKLENAIQDHPRQLKICPIRQEQEIQQKFMICSSCNRQCENYYQCGICPLNVICSQCKDKINQHEHPMAHSFSSTKQLETKRCSNCQLDIQNVCEACRICQKNKTPYLLCHQCRADKSYNHEHDEFYVRLLMDNRSLKKQKSYMQEEEEDDNIFIPYKIQFKHSVSQQMIQPAKSPARLSRFHLKTQEQQQFQVYSGEICTSIHPQSQSQIQEQVKLLSPVKKKDVMVNFEQSQVIMQISLLQSQQYQQAPALNFFSLNKKIVDQTPVQIKQVDSSEDEKQTQKQFRFQGYECDICKTLPIKNIRYHCNICDDYDLCQDCYKKNLYLHQHNDFSMINGIERQKQKIQRFKQIARSYTFKNFY